MCIKKFQKKYYHEIMKTLLLTIQYPPHVGGVSRFYYYFSKFLPEDEIVVLTAKDGDWKTSDRERKFSVYRLKPLNWYKTKSKILFLAINICLFFYTLFVVLKEKVRIIIAGRASIDVLFVCYLLKLMLNKDYIVFAHGDGESPNVKCKIDIVKEYFYKRAKGFIANSFFTKKRLIDKYAIPENKIFVLYPGVDTKIFSPKNSEDFKQKLGLNWKKILLTAGRLDIRKGHDMVLKALPGIIREVPSVVYLIIGKGAYQFELQILAKELNVEKYVRFLGYVSDDEMVKYYNLCDVFIMPNRELDGGDTEGFGMVFIEANACGKPTIGGRCGGAVEAIRDNVTGLLVDPCSIKEIEQKSIYLLKNDRVLKNLGEIGRQRAVSEFDWERRVKEDINRIKKIML